MRTLVYHTGGIGDFITTLPAINYWKKEQNCTITLLGRPYIAELSNIFEEINDVDSKLYLSLFKKESNKEFLFKFFKNFDNVILFCSADSPLLSNVRAFFPEDNYKWQNPFPETRIHIIDYHFSLFHPSPEELSINLRTPYIEVESDFSLLNSSEKGVLVAIHPGSGSRIKNWDYSNFKKVAEILNSKGAKILWIVGPAENSLDFPQEDIVIKNLSLKKCAKILKLCNLFIGNDSGISHLASAVGCKSIVIFGPSDPLVWAPRGKEIVKILWKPSSCTPCHPIKKINTQCNLHCLHSIKVEEVINAAEEILFLDQSQKLPYIQG
ncbi:MAG: glycosyltransferase family 9 protein [Chitinispirillaceae bacterium]|nr:glycosyltransferase family 9 protein [Chitinispirillaceae bacterium]